jgi:hypothetical protein
MKAAATRRGFGVNFRRTNGDLLRFQIVANGSGDGAVAEIREVVSSEPPAPAKRKGGRPKKNP